MNKNTELSILETIQHLISICPEPDSIDKKVIKDLKQGLNKLKTEVNKVRNDLKNKEGLKDVNGSKGNLLR